MRQFQAVFSTCLRVSGGRSLLRVGASTAAILATFSASTALAQTWQGTVSDDWLDAGNWLGGVPVGNDGIFIDQILPNPTTLNSIVDVGIGSPLVIGRSGEGSLTILDGGRLQGGIVAVGTTDTGKGTLALDGGVIVASELTMGWAENSFGRVELTGSDASLTTDRAYIGGDQTISVSGGTAELAIRDGAKMTTTYIATLGVGATATAETLVSGLGSRWDVGTNFIAGSGGGAATLVIEDQAMMTTGSWASLGYLGSGSEARATVRDADSRWTIEKELFVGYEGKGVLEVLGGGRVEILTHARIGAVAGSVGEATVSGKDSSGQSSIMEIKDYLHIGSAGQGSLNITDGALVVTRNNTLIGWDTDTRGALTVSGTDSAMIAVGYLAVGNYGKADLLVQNGGIVFSQGTATSGSGGSRIARWAGSVGTATVTGPGSIWDNGDQLIVGYEGQGTLTVSDGGEVRADRIDIALESGSEGHLIVGGSGATAAAVRADEIAFGAGSGTLTLDYSGAPQTMAAKLSGAGTVAARNGVTTLTGDSSGFAGTTTVHGGTLLVGDTAGNGALGGQVIVKSGATLGGSGHIGMNPLTTGGNALIYNVVESGGILAPGSSGLGTLTLSGGWEFHAGSQLHFQIGAPGNATNPGTSDLIVMGDMYSHLNLAGKPELHISDAGGAGVGHYRIVTLNHASATLGQGGSFTIIQPGPVSGASYRVAQVWEPDFTDWHFDLIVEGTSNLQYWQDNSATWTDIGLNWRNAGEPVDVTWAGNHGVFNGTGSAIAVSGTHSFEGLQFVTSGYRLDGLGTLQTVAGGSELRVLGGETATIAATIAGAGGIFKTQGGELVLRGVNTYTGATTIEAGTLALQGGGSIASSAALTFAGGGVLDVAGVAAGNAQIGTLSGVAGSKIVFGATDLTVDQATNGTFAGVISGDGELTKTGIGELFLTGENTYAGDTVIAQGTLSLGDGGTSGSVSGNIVNNNNSLVFNRSENLTYAGVLSGSGATSFIGSGITTLTGNSSGLTGPVNVTAGNLRLASGASLGATMLTVGTGGALSGLGSVVGNLSVAGRLAPGIASTLGTFNVTGNIAFHTGSTYAVSIAGTDPLPSGQTVDSLTVGGTADLTGGAVEIAAIDPRTSYVDGHRYATPILSATGGLGGTEFAGAAMTSDSAFITPTLSYEGNDVFLTIAVTQDFTTAARTFNQSQAAGALNRLEQTSDALRVFNTIANMNEDHARRAFDLTSGEVHAAGQHVIDQTFALFNRTLRYQGVSGIGAGNVGAETFTASLGYGPAMARGNAGVVAIDGVTSQADARVRGAWAAPLGGFGRIDGAGNAGELKWWNGGLAGGYEGVIDLGAGNAVGGLGFGYVRSHGTVDARLSSFDSDGFYLGAYGAWAEGPWTVSSSLSYGANRVSTERNIAFMGTTAEASYWMHSIGLSGEAAYAFDLTDTTRIAPLFTLDAGWSGHGGFNETGAGALNLSSGPESRTRFDAGIGLAVTHAIMTESGRITLEGRAIWEHAFADVVPSQALTLAGSPTGFTVHGPAADRNRLRLGAGLSWDASEDMTVRARYDGLFFGDQNNHTASFGLNIRF